MLPTDIKTRRELMSVALRAETEAIHQYSRLAGEMHRAGNRTTAELFERLAKEEQEHERLLRQWLQQEGIEADDSIDPVRWRDPNVDTTYNEEARSPGQSTPYRALAFAVHNEETAFRFYTQVAAEAADPKVREYAEVLAHEELGHAALLRAERRRAYHEERDHAPVEPAPEPGMVNNEADLLLSALCFDRLLADRLESIDPLPEELQRLAGDVRRQIEEEEKSLQAVQDRNIVASDAVSQKLEETALYNTRLIDGLKETSEKLQHLYSCCERLFSFYDSVVAGTDNEQVMLRAQQLTSSTLSRISVLKQALAD